MRFTWEKYDGPNGGWYGQVWDEELDVHVHTSPEFPMKADLRLYMAGYMAGLEAAVAVLAPRF